MKGAPSLSPKSKSRQTFGCDSDATARASRSKRTRSACGASSFTATRRPSSRSSAAQTAAIPPAPSRSTSR